MMANLPNKSSVEGLSELLIRSKVYDLSQPLFNGMPVHPEDPPFTFALYRYHEHTSKIFASKAPGFSDSMELVVTSMHSGTHMDAKCHMARNGKLYEGVNASEIESHKGYSKYGIEEAGILILRAVLLDLPRSKDLDILPERYGITANDLQEAAKNQGVEIRRGDAALVRTGYSRYFREDPHKYLHDFAGVTVDGAKWLIGNKIALAGSDNLAYAVPMPFEVHLMYLVDNGIYMMKSLYLEDLARDKQYVSTLIVTPLKILGATGSLVRPIALASR